CRFCALVAFLSGGPQKNCTTLVEVLGMADMAQQLTSIARKMRVNFSLNGRPLTLDEVFSATGLLPGIAKRADQLASLCLGYGIGVTFEEAEGAILGNRVLFDEITPTVLRLMCM